MPAHLGRSVALVQTDTTVGLLSKRGDRLNRAKDRADDKALIRAVGSFRTLQRFARVPAAHKNRVRRMKKTTFVFGKSESCRVIAGDHRHFFERIGWAFTTSANPTGGAFGEAWAKDRSDLWVLTPKGFCEYPASRLLKLGKTRLKKLR